MNLKSCFDLLLAGIFCAMVLTPARAPGAVLFEGAGGDGGMAEYNNRFGFKLFLALQRDAPDKNLFISPSSIATAMQMVRQGAVGPTRDALTRVLELGREQTDKPAFAPLPADAPVALSVANSLWANQRIKLQPGYTARMKQDYAAQVQALDFSSPKSPGVINKWVASRTHNRITDMVSKLSATDALILINAIYFKGTWLRPFEKEATQDAPFHPASGGGKQVKMMHQSGRFDYQEGKGFQAIRLPYKGGQVEMLIFLPDAALGLNGLLSGLDEARWNTWLGGFEMRQGSLGLPRFKIEYEATLNDPLKALGCALAFDPDRADFSAMIAPPDKAFLSEVKHKSFVEVNEEGTEAAAATSARMSLSMAPAGEPFQMIVDRPFLCAIRDTRSGEILFLGAIQTP